jgi:hypothetical protein
MTDLETQIGESASRSRGSNTWTQLYVAHIERAPESGDCESDAVQVLVTKGGGYQEDRDEHN